jgi:hypothetical protein
MRDENTKISALPIPRATEKPQTFEFFRQLLESFSSEADNGLRHENALKQRSRAAF